MPSPLPGMDPFLEDPAIFPDLHDSLITYLREALNARLPEPYFATSASRVWVEPSRRHIGSDVNVLRPGQADNGSPAGTAGGGTAVAEAAAPVMVHVPREEVRETFLEIRSRSGERLVTAVEVLSPTNKTPGSPGAALYLQKQQEVLESEAHLVEIDLLRAGEHATAVPPEHARALAGAFDYHVCVHTFDRPDDYLIYPVRLGQRLPTVAIPLLPGDPSPPIDLQDLLNRCYDTGNYRRRVRYHLPPPDPPLSPEQTAWVEQTLREQGILAAS